MPHDSHEAIRQARAAGREAIREAREAAREQARQSRESLKEAIRRARDAESVARQAPAAEPDTRTRIQQIALDLFTEHGYEATSLREIAERLGVTKAALYYHFRTKDEIIESLVQDRVAGISELLEWAGDQPRSAEVRREFLRRYSDMLHEHGHHELMRFFERNQSSMGQHRAGAVMKGKLVEMLDILSDRDAPLTEQVRSSLAIFALHSTWFVLRDPDITDDQRRAAALEVALSLVAQ